VKQLISQGGDGQTPGVPQGTIAERVRAGAAGIPAFYTPTSVGTNMAKGKEHREFNGRTYVLETALTADYAFVRAHKADTAGNLQYRLSQMNSNPLVARAARFTIAEVEEPIVEAGDLDPSFVHTPGIYVNRIVKIPPAPEGFEDRRYNIFGAATTAKSATRGIGSEAEADDTGKKKLDREQMVLRLIKEFEEGWVVNLGMGLPQFCCMFTPPELGVVFHAENGVIGYSGMATAENFDLHLVDALGYHITLGPGASVVDHAESFALVRSGRLDVTVLGAYQVAENGDLASVGREPGSEGGAGGGAMDMAANAQRVFVPMQHNRDDGEPRLVERCNLPITAPGVVKMVFTDLGVFEVTPEGFLMREIAPGWTVNEVQALSGATIHAASDLTEVKA
jgi:3-oxoacid CoA-transferase